MKSIYMYILAIGSIIAIIFLQANDQINTTIGISYIALIVSLFSPFILHRNRLETNRPIVTVLLETYKGGNISTALNLKIYNTGNTPAINVVLRGNKDDISKSLNSTTENKFSDTIYACLSEDNIIPIIHNNNNVVNSFGLISQDNNQTFKCGSKINLKISYQDIYGHKYKHNQILTIQDTTNFAGTGWK